MNRLTITLSEARYRALKQAAARRGKPMGQLIDESLEYYGIKTQDEAADIVRRARAHAALDAAQAMDLALDVTREVRGQ